MNGLLKLTNIVLIGNFNPSQFDKLFFVKNNIFKEDEILPSSIHTIDGVQLTTKEFNIIAIFNQIIITAINPDESEKIKEISLLIVKSANTVICTALGFNFHWDIIAQNSLEETSRHYFYNEKNILMDKFFNTRDSVYGVYASRDVKNSRLKLDVKPQRIKRYNSETEIDILNFAFNFHFDIKTKHLDTMEILKNYDEYFQESKNIMNIYG